MLTFEPEVITCPRFSQQTPDSWRKNKIRIYKTENVSCNESVNGHVGFGNFTNSPSFTQPVEVLNGFKTLSLTTPTLLGFPFHWDGKAKNRGWTNNLV